MQQKEALQVHAGIAGVLEEVTVDAGQQVAPGTNLAKIRSSARLMARLHVPESQSRDLQLNQKAQIELQDRPYSGHVARIDHGVQNEAERVMVELGNASIDSVEIVAGLQPGDRVIVSDMSTWSKYDRLLVQ